MDYASRFRGCDRHRRVCGSLGPPCAHRFIPQVRNQAPFLALTCVEIAVHGMLPGASIGALEDTWLASRERMDYADGLEVPFEGCVKEAVRKSQIGRASRRRGSEA